MELSESAGLAARYIAQSGALESEFILVDIGVRGGIHPRWRPLEPVLQVYGFDAVAEVSSPNPRHRYFKLALGSYDGECAFHVPTNPYEGRVAADGAHKVPIARLDTLWADRRLPSADFIKIDCENYEPEILAGGVEYLKASSLIGADIETHFHVLPGLPYTHFAAINAALTDCGLRMADLTLSRALGADQPWNGTANALFSRHLLDPFHDSAPTADVVLKTVAVFDIYGLSGPAIAVAEKFRHVFAARIDADALLKKLSISPRAATLERYLPHLGLGLWTRAKARLAR